MGMPPADSSNTSSLGYAQETGLPWELGLIRNHSVGRTFIRPSQEIRDYSVRKKYNPVRHIIEGGTSIREVARVADLTERMS